MILGTGLISKSIHTFLDHKDLCVFACGVSNSNETNDQEYNRELDLLKKVIKTQKEKKLIYFSTSSIETERKSKYIEHKLKVEALIEEQCEDFLIIRLPNIVGRHSNPFQLVTFFYNSLIEEREVTIVPNYYRSLMDVEDIPKLITLLLNKEISIKKINTSFKNKVTVKELLSIIEEVVGKKYKKILEKEGPYEAEPDNRIFLDLIKNQETLFNIEPVNIIQKYYFK